MKKNLYLLDSNQKVKLDNFSKVIKQEGKELNKTDQDQGNTWT